MSSQEKEDKETYLSGFSSPSIRSKAGSLKRLGVYATNKRIFIIRAPLKMELMQAPLLLIAVVVLLYDVILGLMYFRTNISHFSLFFAPLELVGIAILLAGIATSWYNDLSPVPIQELERRNGVEIHRGQISRIEMRDRGSLLPSKITIVLNRGDRITMTFDVNGSFQRARRIFQTFASEVCVDFR